MKFAGQNRENMSLGSIVEIVQKHHQKTGELTEGVIDKFLTRSPEHPHGIKVRLVTGEVGRVKNVILK